MAVTFNQIPKTWSPSDNELIYVYSSNQTTQPNFSFVVETYYNGIKVSENRTFVENGTKSHIDISSIISMLLPTPTQGDALVNIITSGLIKLKVYESYGTTVSLHANATSTETNIWKASISNEQMVSVDFDSDYKTLKWLTNEPTKIITTSTEKDVFISMLTDASTDITINTYDNDNTLVDVYTFSNDEDVIQLNLNSSILSGEGVTMSGVSYITVQIGTSEIYTIRYSDLTCDEVNNLQWINEYGCFDQFNFGYKHEVKAKTESKGIVKSFGGWSGGSYVLSLDSGDRNYQVITNKRGTITSGYISEFVQNWLCESVESPRHYLNGSAIKVTTANYTVEQDEFEDLIYFEIGYDFSHAKKSILL